MVQMTSTSYCDTFTSDFFHIDLYSSPSKPKSRRNSLALIEAQLKIPKETSAVGNTTAQAEPEMQLKQQDGHTMVHQPVIKSNAQDILRSNNNRSGAFTQRQRTLLLADGQRRRKDAGRSINNFERRRTDIQRHTSRSGASLDVVLPSLASSADMPRGGVSSLAGRDVQSLNTPTTDAAAQRQLKYMSGDKKRDRKFNATSHVDPQNTTDPKHLVAQYRNGANLKEILEYIGCPDERTANQNSQLPHQISPRPRHNYSKMKSNNEDRASRRKQGAEQNSTAAKSKPPSTPPVDLKFPPIERHPSAKTWKTWRDVNESYAYNDVKKYIAENELMTVEKETRIQRWIAEVNRSMANGEAGISDDEITDESR